MEGCPRLESPASRSARARGWLERKFGFAADNVLSAEVVLADGSLVRASESENSDLFWGLRGGGGNFGVVTEFEFQLHPVEPMMLGGMLLYPGPRAPDAVRFFREFIATAPDEVGAVALLTAPPEPFVPEPARGRPAVGIIACYAGELQEGEQALAPLREFGPPAVELVQPMPYTAVQRLIDQSAPAGAAELLARRLPERSLGRRHRCVLRSRGRGALASHHDLDRARRRANRPRL